MNRMIFDADSESLTDLLLNRLLTGGTYYILFDGIDECGPSEVQSILACLSTLLREHQSVKVLVASRVNVNGAMYRTLGTKCKIVVSEANTQSDLKVYIEETLQQRLDKDLTLIDPRTIVEIYNKLLDQSQGM